MVDPAPQVRRRRRERERPAADQVHDLVHPAGQLAGRFLGAGVQRFEHVRSVPSSTPARIRPSSMWPTTVRPPTGLRTSVSSVASGDGAVTSAGPQRLVEVVDRDVAVHRQVGQRRQLLRAERQPLAVAGGERFAEQVHHHRERRRLPVVVESSRQRSSGVSAVGTAMCRSSATGAASAAASTSTAAAAVAAASTVAGTCSPQAGIDSWPPAMRDVEPAREPAVDGDHGDRRQAASSAQPSSIVAGDDHDGRGWPRLPLADPPVQHRRCRLVVARVARCRRRRPRLPLIEVTPASSVGAGDVDVDEDHRRPLRERGAGDLPHHAGQPGRDRRVVAGDVDAGDGLQVEQQLAGRLVAERDQGGHDRRHVGDRVRGRRRCGVRRAATPARRPSPPVRWRRRRDLGERHLERRRRRAGPAAPSTPPGRPAAARWASRRSSAAIQVTSETSRPASSRVALHGATGAGRSMGAGPLRRPVATQSPSRRRGRRTRPRDMPARPPTVARRRPVARPCDRCGRRRRLPARPVVGDVGRGGSGPCRPASPYAGGSA